MVTSKDGWGFIYAKYGCDVTNCCRDFITWTDAELTEEHLADDIEAIKEDDSIDADEEFIECYKAVFKRLMADYKEEQDD